MQAAVDIPHKPSLTLEDGIFLGLKPAFVQWYIPLEQADVPKKKYKKSVRSLFSRLKASAKFC